MIIKWGRIISKGGGVPLLEEGFYCAKIRKVEEL